ncbi:fungal-specific transcription factor domain-domain-containing protein [Absidia repens]|uniref:Fungal-specific transcription factor domain-domain-containing protein n=1 Tax=Absidia repens TaxID=90262 RepID=A0A1X2I6W3_9FUNG|nr:fungal-specific transcription factor domain-domain-containing protein [Absidia repens]
MLTGGPMTSLVNESLPQKFKLQLAEKYFANFNLFLPILSRHHFLHQLVHQPDDMDQLLCYAVCAMGSRYLEHRDDMERLYFERCLLLFEKLKTDEPTIASIQGVIIMCWYTFMMGDFKKCACLRRHLVEYVRRLNLGINADPSLSIVQTEQRRRTFWVIYVTDAWLAFYTDARLINMEKEGWNCKKPILEDSQLQAIDSRNLKWQVDHPPIVLQDETTEAALQIPSFVELIQLASIVGDMFDCLRSSSSTHVPQDLESRLNDWFRHLPSYLEYGKLDTDNSPAPIAKTIRILYHTVQIMMHQSPLLDMDQYSRSDICNNAADSIIHIAGQMLQQQDELKLYNTFAMSITLATSVHLESMMTGQGQDDDSKTRLGRSVRVLKDANCSYLARVDFDRLVDRFLTNRCGLRLDEGFKSSHQLAGMWQILYRSRQGMTTDQQRQFISNLNHSGISPLYSKTTESVEPVVLSADSLVDHSASASASHQHHLDIDGILNDSMTDLICNGTVASVFDLIPSSSWAEYVSNNHIPLTAPTTADTTNGPDSPSSCHQNKQQQQRYSLSQQSPSATTTTYHDNSASGGGLQDMDSSGSSASPSYSPIYSPDQDNCIRLLPASTLLSSTNQHMNHQDACLTDSNNLPNGFVI